MGKPIIKIENLNVTYFAGKDNEVQALKNINLELFPSEFIIFFGPSGCGKSTLMYSIAGLQPNVTGDIYLNDKNLTKLRQKELEYIHQKKIGMVFQAFYLINSVTVMQNVMMPQIAIGGKRKEREEKAMKLLEHFGVKPQAHKLPLELSGGQQQRVAICRALINDPDILLADEPVGNLDSKSAHDVMTLLQELNQKQEKTVILVTHDPSYLNYAHRVVYMRDGKIIEVKVNRSISQVEKAAIASGEGEKSNIPKDLELLVRTYSSILPNQIGGLLIPFKAKQIVSDILTEMTMEEISKIENRVEKLLISGSNDNNITFEFLDKDEEKGGMGLDKRTALYLTQKIKDVVAEIKYLEVKETELQKNNQAEIAPEELKHVRNYLLNTFDVDIKKTDDLKRVDAVIRERLDNKIDKVSLQKRLDLAVSKGGAGLDKRISKKIAQRLELLILGKYK